MYSNTVLYNPPHFPSPQQQQQQQQQQCQHVAPTVVISETVFDPCDEQKHACYRAHSVSVVARTAPVAPATEQQDSTGATKCKDAAGTSQQQQPSTASVDKSSASSAEPTDGPVPAAAVAVPQQSSAAGDKDAAATSRTTPVSQAVGRDSVNATPVDPSLGAAATSTASAAGTAPQPPILRPPVFDIVLLRTRPVLAETSSASVAATTVPETDFVHVATSPVMVKAVAAVSVPDWLVPSSLLLEAPNTPLEAASERKREQQQQQHDQGGFDLSPEQSGPFVLISYISEQPQQFTVPQTAPASAAEKANTVPATGSVAAASAGAGPANTASSSGQSSPEETSAGATAKNNAAAAATAAAGDASSAASASVAPSPVGSTPAVPTPAASPAPAKPGLHAVRVVLFNVRTGTNVAMAAKEITLEEDINVLRAFCCLVPRQTEESWSSGNSSEIAATLLLSVTGTSGRPPSLAFEKAPHVIPLSIKVSRKQQPQQPQQKKPAAESTTVDPPFLAAAAAGAGETSGAPVAATATAAAATGAEGVASPVSSSSGIMEPASTSSAVSVAASQQQQPKQVPLVISVLHAKSSAFSSDAAESLFGSAALQALCCECRSPLISMDATFFFASAAAGTGAGGSNCHYVLSCVDGGVHTVSFPASAAAPPAAAAAATAASTKPPAFETHSFQLDVPAHQIIFFWPESCCQQHQDQDPQQRPIFSLLRKIRRATKRAAKAAAAANAAGASSEKAGTVPPSAAIPKADSVATAMSDVPQTPLTPVEPSSAVRSSSAAVSNSSFAGAVPPRAAATSVVWALSDGGIVALDLCGQVSVLRAETASQIWMTQTVVFNAPAHPAVAVAVTRSMECVCACDSESATNFDSQLVWLSLLTSDRVLRVMSCEFLSKSGAVGGNSPMIPTAAGAASFAAAVGEKDESAAGSSGATAAAVTEIKKPPATVDPPASVILVSPTATFDLSHRPVSAVYSLDCASLTSISNDNEQGGAVGAWPGVAVLTTDATVDTLVEAASLEASDSLVSSAAFLESVLAAGAT